MNLLLLVNHNTAALSIAHVLTALDHKVYIPLHCDIELHTLQGDAVKSVRTIHDPILDRINFYSSAEAADLSRIVQRINEFYHVVIIGTPFLFEAFIRALSLHSTKKVILLFWGDHRDCDLLTAWPFLAEIRDHPCIFNGFTLPILYRLDTQNQLKHKILTPMSMSPWLSPYVNTWNGMEKKGKGEGVVVISRIDSEYSSALYSKAVYLINQYRLDLCFYGKNAKTRLLFPHKHRFGCTEVEIYQDMSTSYSYFVYLVSDRQLVQYSALEAIAVGLPVFYFSCTLLSELINSTDAKDPFRCDSLDDMGNKICAHVQNPSDRSLSRQKHALSYFDHSKAVECWSKIIV